MRKENRLLIALYLFACLAWISFSIFVVRAASSKAQLLAPVPIQLANTAPAAPPVPKAIVPPTTSLPIPTDAVWNMYNAVSQDETEIRNLILAIPVLLTFLLAFVPFAVTSFIEGKVQAAVDTRVKQTEDKVVEATKALGDATKKVDATATKIDESLKAQEAHIGTELDHVTKNLESKMHKQEAFLRLRVAYLHWNQGDADLAAVYAKKALGDLALAKQLLGSDPALEAIRVSENDALDSKAYYVAELFETAGGLDDDADKAKERGVHMLTEFRPAVDASRPASALYLIERIDTCLFVIWAFRNHLPDGVLSRGTDLFREWKIALENHAWKDRQQVNYLKYKAHYDSVLSSQLASRKS